jgi:hypothetical protein
MCAVTRGIALSLPLLAVLLCGQDYELKGRLFGTVVDRSGRPVPIARIVLYEIGHDDSTAQTQPNAKSGEFEILIRRDRAYRLVAESVCMTSKAIERVDLRSVGDTQLPPIVLERRYLISCGFGEEIGFKTEYSPEELQRRLEFISLPLTRSAIDLRVLFPPVEFQPEIKGAQRRNRRPKPSDRAR